MLDVLLLQRTEVADGPLVQLGPSGGVLNRSLLLPSTFSRAALFSSNNLKVTISCELVAEKYEVKSVSVEALGGYVSTRDLTQLGIPRIIRQVATDLVPDFKFWTAQGMKENGYYESIRNDFVYLAQMYWLHTAVHGKPRIEIAEALGISKSTSNVLLRRIESEVPLPRETCTSFAEAATVKSRVIS